MSIIYYPDVEQGSEEWRAIRCGLLTASEMRLILTPTLKTASNDEERAHVFEIAAQRITGYTDPQYIGDDMLRGHEDEVLARARYVDHFAPVSECGFVTRDMGGFLIGYSPDGLVGDDGLIECKSRRQKYQVETIMANSIPSEYMLQIQTGLIVTGRKWLDFLSYSAGLPMFVKRVWPDSDMQQAIIKAATEFHVRVQSVVDRYRRNVSAMPVVINTERVIEEEMHL